MAKRDYPPDIDAESGNRLPLPNRDELPDDAKEIFDRFKEVSNRSIVGLRGPGGIRLNSPRLSVLTQPLNTYLRWEASYSGAVRELAILVTARAHDNQFEWAQHEPAALKEGVSPETIEVVRTGAAVDGLDETEAAIITLGREIFYDRKVSAETYARVSTLFDKATLVDLISLMGMYAATAVMLTAFDIQLLDGQEPRLPTDKDN